MFRTLVFVGVKRNIDVISILLSYNSVIDNNPQIYGIQIYGIYIYGIQST
jgi:hypothetical protein